MKKQDWKNFQSKSAAINILKSHQRFKEIEFFQKILLMFTNTKNK